MVCGFAGAAKRTPNSVSLPVINQFAYKAVITLSAGSVVVQSFLGIPLKGNGGMAGIIVIVTAFFLRF
jgi:hypothetical protein